MTHPASVSAHYGTGQLIESVLQVLRTAGVVDHATWQALSPLDQFHVGGEVATQDLAGKLAITPGSSVLDVGCGLGGPSRHLASEFDCTVTGIDLNPHYVELASLLTGLAGLQHKVTHLQGDATRLPFDSERFDFAWTQHVAMNIADRAQLYDGIFRVLRPGGRLALYDVVAGDAGGFYWPVPWSRGPENSFLLSADATCDALGRSGFVIRQRFDATRLGIGWQQEQAAAAQNRPPRLKALNLALVMGPEFPGMTANLRRNLQEGHAGLVQVIAERPM